MTEKVQNDRIFVSSGGPVIRKRLVILHGHLHKKQNESIKSFSGPGTWYLHEVDFLLTNVIADDLVPSRRTRLRTYSRLNIYENHYTQIFDFLRNWKVNLCDSPSHFYVHCIMMPQRWQSNGPAPYVEPDRRACQDQCLSDAYHLGFWQRLEGWEDHGTCILGWNCEGEKVLRSRAKRVSDTNSHTSSIVENWLLR